VVDGEAGEARAPAEKLFSSKLRRSVLLKSGSKYLPRPAARLFEKAVPTQKSRRRQRRLVPVQSSEEKYWRPCWESMLVEVSRLVSRHVARTFARSSRLLHL
jgi:hypothetical protein